MCKFIKSLIIYLWVLLNIKNAFGNDNNTDIIDHRIVGGNNATKIIGYQVSLRNQCMNHFCAGGIINNRWVLTAAHCLTSGLAKYVSVGTTNIIPDYQVYIVKRYVINPRYDRLRLANDIGLIQTASEIVFNKRIWPLLLPRRNISGDVELNVAGWGRTNFPGELPKHLQVLKVKYISNEVCEDLMNRTIYPTNLCTYQGIGKGFCHGDSGGPVVLGKFIHGVISYGRPCAIGFPDVNTRVFRYITWINTEIKSYND